MAAWAKSYIHDAQKAQGGKGPIQGPTPPPVRPQPPPTTVKPAGPPRPTPEDFRRLDQAFAPNAPSYQPKSTPLNETPGRPTRTTTPRAGTKNGETGQPPAMNTTDLRDPNLKLSPEEAARFREALFTPRTAPAVAARGDTYIENFIDQHIADEKFNAAPDAPKKYAEKAEQLLTFIEKVLNADTQKLNKETVERMREQIRKLYAGVPAQYQEKLDKTYWWLRNGHKKTEPVADGMAAQLKKLP